ncbi:MAG: glutamyl-tRNA reductase [Gammaproteobacteria bacterium]
MSLYLLGINHRTAPVELREHVAFDPAELPETLSGMAGLPGVVEAAILSTCNRTELYAVVDDSADTVRQWLVDKLPPGTDSGPCLYELSGDGVIDHTCRVACGLDSAVLGEPQILGQMKDTYRLAQAQATAGPQLHRLFQHTFGVAKKVRTQTAIGESYVSAASATIELARQVFDGFEKRTALLIGAGEMIELTLKHFRNQNLGQAIIANRSLDRAQALASEHGAAVVGLDQISSQLPNADIVISCTASPNRVVEHEHVREALRQRRRRPMMLMDLAVPRDIAPEVATLNDAYLYTVDDLREVVTNNQAARVKAAQDAEAMIGVHTSEFSRRQDALQAVPLIKSVRSQLNAVRDQALAQAQRQVAAGKSIDDVLERMADTITNRLLHEPSTQLREAGEQGDRELLEVASRLFGIGKDAG